MRAKRTFEILAPILIIIHGMIGGENMVRVVTNGVPSDLYTNANGTVLIIDHGTDKRKIEIDLTKEVKEYLKVIIAK
jgi:hypothetical protein